MTEKSSNRKQCHVSNGQEQNYERSRLVLAMACLPVLLTLTGCLDLATRGIIGATMVDGASYSEVSSTAGNIGETQARVWVYAVGGRSVVNQAGVEEPITFNQDVYRFLGDTFFHIDLPAAHYTVTTTGTRGFRSFHPGEIQKEVQFESGKEYFLRVQCPRGLEKVRYPFDLVEKSQALTEMEGRKQKHYKCGWKLAEIKGKAD